MFPCYVYELAVFVPMISKPPVFLFLYYKRGFRFTMAGFDKDFLAVFFRRIGPQKVAESAPSWGPMVWSSFYRTVSVDFVFAKRMGINTGGGES